MRYLLETRDKEWRPGRLIKATQNVCLSYWHSMEERESALDGCMVYKGTPAMVLKCLPPPPGKRNDQILLLVGEDVLVLRASDGAHAVPFSPITKRDFKR